MALYRPSEPSWYISDDDRHILQQIDSAYQSAITIQQSFWSEADLDTRFRAGDQTLWNELYGNLPAFQKRQFQFNRIRRVCNLISGHQRRNRRSTNFTPREGSDDAAAAQYTKLYKWWDGFANVGENISQAFDQTLTTGMSLLSFWADYRSDPISGDPKVDTLSYNAFVIDPFFRKPDLSDCNYIMTRKYLSKYEAISLAPDQEDEINKLHVRANRDGKFQYLPESYNYTMQDLLTYDEYWYRDYRKQKLLVDLRTGETMEWAGNDDNLKAFVRKYKGRVTTLEQTIPTVKLATLLEGKVLYHGDNPLKIDRFPFVPVLGYYDPQLPYFNIRTQGVVRGLRDAQYLYNRRKAIELDILESQINSGIKAKEDALVNPKDAFMSGQGRFLVLKQSAQMSDVEMIQAPQVPPSMIQLSEILAREMQEISGVNEELLGSADDDKAGILSMLRQSAGITTLQGLFDQLDQSQKYLSQIFLEYCQKNFTPGKIQRILAQEPAQEFYHHCFGKYDVAVEEGINTATQRQQQFIQLLHLREMGIPIPSNILVENATISDKKELAEAMKSQEEQAAQQQQQQQQMQMGVLQAQIDDLQSRAAANKGLGIERESRVEENRALAVERMAEAEKDRDLANLHYVKALKELEGMDLDHLQKAMELLQVIQQTANPAEPQKELGNEKAEQSRSLSGT